MNLAERRISKPLTDRSQRRVFLGAWCRSGRPACALSAGLVLWSRCGAGSPAARGCDGRGDTGQGAASLPPAASRRSCLRPAIACCSRAPGLFKLGGSYGRVGARAWRPRMPTSPPHGPHPTGQWPANPASGCNPTYRQECGQVSSAAVRVGLQEPSGQMMFMDGGPSTGSVTARLRSAPRHASCRSCTRSEL